MQRALDRITMLDFGATTRRQSQNTDEAFGIFLIITRAHGERRKIGAVERIRRLSADNAHVALVKRERSRTGKILLRGLDKSVERLAQRREPQAEVNQFRIFQRNVLLEVQQIAIQAKGLKLAMSREQQRASGSFIAAARLDADKTVFDQIDAADGVPSADLVQQLNQRNR